jgi:tetratricopeptide (TPR) repeat protein
MIKTTFFILLFFSGLQNACSQYVEIPKSKEEAEKIIKRDQEESRRRNLYFDANEKCHDLINEKNFAQAEISCKRAISLAESLPKDSYLERKSAYESLAIVLLRQRRAEEAIPLLNKSLDVAKPVIDDTDAETGELYFWLGQANQQLGKVEIASDYYTKAENTYRTAFKEIEDDEIRQHYPKPILNILEAHLILLNKSGLKEESTKIEKRISETKLEFAKYLKN